MFTNDIIPKDGFILKDWGRIGYRSTAHAYLKRLGLWTIENINGKWYTLKEIEGSIIGFES